MTDLTSSKRKIPRWLWCASPILAVFVLLPISPRFVAAEVPSTAISEPTTNAQNAKEPFGIQAIDAATSQPVSGAVVHYQTDRTGGKITTDADGKAHIPFDPGKDNSISIRISSDFHVPFRLRRSSITDPDYPPISPLLAKLQPGMPIGGLVHDKGEPVKDARVLVTFQAKPNENGSNSYRCELVRTGADGRWKTAQVDPNATQIDIAALHPEFAIDWAGTEADPRGRVEPPFETLKSATHQFRLKRGQTLTGRVLDLDGKPVAGAEVRSDEWPVEFGEASHLTDAKGEFRIGNLGTVQGPVKIAVHKPGLGWCIRSIDVQDQHRVATFQLIPGRTVTGRVIDAEGKPVADVRVDDTVLPRWLRAPDAIRRTDADGRFEIADLPADFVSLIFSKTGYLGYEAKIDPVQSSTVDVVLKKQNVIEGRVTDAATGQPLSDFRIFRLVTDKGVDMDYAVPGRYVDGRFRLPLWPHRGQNGVIPEFRLRIEAPGFESVTTGPMNVNDPVPPLAIALRTIGKADSKSTEGQVLKAEGDSVIRIDQEKPIEQKASAEKSLRLRLIDRATGKPVKDAQVIYVIDQAPKETVRTDEAGFALIPFDAVKMRTLRYRTSVDGYVDTTESWSRDRTLVFPPPAEIERKINRSVAIGGKIVDMQGQPIEGVNVSVIHSVKSIDRNGDSKVKNLTIEARTDASGTFTIDRFDPDAIGAHVYVSHPRFVRAEKEVPQVREPDLLPDLLARRYVSKMQPGKSVSGTVLGPDGQPVEGATIWNDDGTAYFEKIDAQSDADGKFSAGNFGELVRGGFRMAVHKPGVGWAIERVIEAEIDKPRTFRLAPPRRLVVTVRDAEGKPLARSRVLNSFVTDDMWKDPARLTGPDGRYVAQDLPAAELQFSAHMDGFESRHLRVDTISKESVDIVLKPTYAIEGSVTDAVTGEPVDRYRVEQLIDMKNLPQTYPLDSEKSGNRFRILRTTHFADEGKNESFRLRIEAEGYESFDTDSIPAHSRQAPLKIALKPLGPEWYVSGRVLRPDGTPAAGAAVGYFSSRGVDELRYLPALRNGKVIGMQFVRIGQDGMSPWTLIRTGADGTFRFPAHFAYLGWVVSHDSGILKSRDLEPRPASPVELKLEPWSRVEGQLFVDGEPAAETLVRIDYPFAERRKPFFPTPGVNQDQPVRTDAEGRFRFENVLPGEFRLSYGDPGTPIQTNRFAGTFETKAGETLRIETRKSEFHFEEIAFAPDGKEVARSEFGSDRPGFRIYGKITDDETGKPVLGTWSYAFSGYDLVKDVWVAPTNSMSGIFETQAITPLPPGVKPESVNPWLIVVADGYEPYVSPERIRNEGKAVRRDVRLKPIDKSKWNVYKGRVERADGSRANGVWIDFTVGDPGIKIGDVSFRWAMWSNVIFRTNDDGTFEFAFPRTLDRLVFTEGKSVAVVKAAEFASGENRVAKMGAFARIEGRLTRGGKPLEKLGIGLDQGLIPSSMSLIDPQRDIRPDGTFTISKVMPGPVTILFNDAKDLRKVTRVKTVELECKPGETARVEVDVDVAAQPEHKSQTSAISKPVVPDSKPGESEKAANSKPGDIPKFAETTKAVDSKRPAAPPKPEFPAPSGKFITGKVLKPDGSPAVGAEVGFFTTTDDRNDRYLPRLMRNGRIEAIEHRAIVRGQWKNSEREPIRTDAEGRFRLPVWAEKFGWCVTHDSGVLRSTKFVEMAEGETELKLEPWGRIEGTLLLDERPRAGVTLDGQPNFDIGENRFLNPMPTSIRTDPYGRIVIERALPGPYRFAFPNPASIHGGSWRMSDHDLTVPAGGTLRLEVNQTMFGWEERLKDDSGKIVDRKTYGAMRPGFRVYGQVIDFDSGVPVEPMSAWLVSGAKDDPRDVIADERPGSVFQLDFIMIPKGPGELGEIDPYLVVIAPGYEPYVSAERIKKGDSPVHHDVRLKKLPPEKTLTIEGQMLDPDGKPPRLAFYRKVVHGETVNVGETRFSWKFVTENPPFAVDHGRFRFTAPNVPGRLFFASQVGFTQIEASEFAKLPGGVVRLKPWGKVRLRVLRNGKADPDFNFTNDHRESWKLSFVPSASWYPADDGSFLLDRLPPMPVELCVLAKSAKGSKFVLKTVTVEAKSGETTDVDVVVTDEELKEAEAILKARQAGN